MAASVRTCLVVVGLTVYSFLLGPPVLLLTWLSGSPRTLYRLSRLALRMALWLAGIRFRVVGFERLDPQQNYLFLPNHQSNVDPPVMLLALGRDVRMMAKAQLFRLPLLGQALHLAGFVPVVRENRERAISAVDVAAGWLRRGRDFVVFPEGTRSRNGQLLPLKKGPFFLAVKGQVPIVPVVIRGTAGLMPRGSRRILSGRVAVEILEPIPTRGCGVDDRDGLRFRVREALSARLQGAGGPVA
ncbi:MAG: lysophospholipid acyltransferase family protein [Acidobacteriota bacterium]